MIMCDLGCLGSNSAQERPVLLLALAHQAQHALLGIGFDIDLTLQWLATPARDMTDSVHEAFAATLAIVLGVNLMFSSFLMYLLLSEQVPAGSAPRREDHVRSRLPEES